MAWTSLTKLCQHLHRSNHKHNYSLVLNSKDFFSYSFFVLRKGRAPNLCQVLQVPLQLRPHPHLRQARRLWHAGSHHDHHGDLDLAGEGGDDGWDGCINGNKLLPATRQESLLCTGLQWRSRSSSVGLRQTEVFYWFCRLLLLFIWDQERPSYLSNSRSDLCQMVQNVTNTVSPHLKDRQSSSAKQVFLPLNIITNLPFLDPLNQLPSLPVHCFGDLHSIFEAWPKIWMGALYLLECHRMCLKIC